MTNKEDLHQKIIEELHQIYLVLLNLGKLDIDLINETYKKRDLLIQILKKSNYRSKTIEEKNLFLNLALIDKKIVDQINIEKAKTLQELKKHHLNLKTHQAYLSYGGKHGKG